MKEKAEVIHHNAEVFGGRGKLGKAFISACELGVLHGGLQFVDLLVDPVEGTIVEVLPPDPTRRFERSSGLRSVSYAPKSLSMDFPQAVPVIALVDLRKGMRVVDVSAGGWLIGWALECLRAAALHSPNVQSRAA
ncbi:MAG: hypothetical protein QY326_07395 [Bdellovibrionota bacterium]|nr:MAG: hypothetical protein QY326_07395 [Bdellovibrionota bacterium]